MKIEKGKLYYDKVNKEVRLAYTDFYDDNEVRFTDKIAVHCPTKDDWDYVVKRLNLTWAVESHFSRYKNIVIYINEDLFGGLEYIDKNYHIITIDQFKQFYPSNEEQDKFAELKEAHKNGAIIECLQTDGTWFEVEKPQWQAECKYRIKPISKEEQKELLVELSNSEPYDDPYNWVNNNLSKDKVQLFSGGMNVDDKPTHYAKGIDTFARMEANCTKEECLAFIKGNIDKYNWRTKGKDKDDFKKIISYANWALKLLEKDEN